MELTALKASGAFIIGLSDRGEKVTAAGCRISTQEGTALQIWQESQDAERNRRLIDKVLRSGHDSVAEHTHFNLAFQNVSAAAEQFVIEFRLASFTVKSRRYVDFSGAGFYVPQNADAGYRAHMQRLFALYSKLCAAGVPKEDARFVLPCCLFSNFFCSLNAREFLHLLREMLLGRGRGFPEIYDLGLSLKEQAEALTPGLMTGFGKRAKEKQNDVPDLGFVRLPKHGGGAESSVELLAFTPEPEKCVARAALIADANADGADIERALEDRGTVDKIIEAVMRCSQPRALEAANFTLRFNRVSLPCVTHFTRHRLQGLSVPSLTKTDRGRYIIPETVSGRPELLAEYKAAFAENAAEYARLKALGYGENDLVYYLLCGSALDLVTTMNARELLLFMKLRTCSRAQWEIRAFAAEALRLLRRSAPGLFRFYGPSCFVTGRCPEGKLSCGRAAEMKKLFKMRPETNQERE